MQTKKKAFTLVEMIVAMAVSTIIIAGAYASYDMVKTQYTKNLDLSQMQQSGRAIMQMIERDARMAGFEYLDEDANMTYGKISSPLTIKDSGNKCCDELTVIYDYVDDVLDWKGRLVSSSVNRIRVRYWTEAFTSKKGDRFRLYKQKDILGKSNVLLTKPIIGNKEVMADFIEDLQFFNVEKTEYTFVDNGLVGGFNAWVPSKELGKGGKVNKEFVVSNLKGQVCGLAFDPRGFIFAGSCQGGGIYKINLSTGSQTKLNSSIDKVTALAFNKENQKLYVGHGRHGEGGLDIIDPESGNTEDKITIPIRCNEYVSGATSMGFYQPLNQLYIGQASHYSYVIIDPNTKECSNYQGGNLSNYSLPQSARAAAGDSNGYMYFGGSGGRLYAVKDSNYITNNKILVNLMNNGVYGGDYAATIGHVNSGNENLVNINLILRTKNTYGKNKQFIKKDYFIGNFKLDKTDAYKRETFSSKVLARNLI